LANWPTFDPQNLSESLQEQRTNRAIVEPYEPGSTIKPFIMGPALAWRVTRPNEIWPIHAISYVPYGSRRVTDVHFYGELCSWDVLVKSSNIGMSMLAERMGNPSLYRALKSFGFGEPSGIELPGEDGGRVNALKKWTHYSTESIAQGYEMMVTPLQLARAFCVYANGGRLIRPHIIEGTLDAEGNIKPKTFPAGVESCPRVMDNEATLQIRQILSDVMIRGTAAKKGSKYWNIFGKTGTAHISRGKSGYAPDLYNSSFICGAPLEDPRIVVVMAIHEPDRKMGYYGGAVSAPAAVRVVERTLGYLQVPASPAIQPPPPEVVPHLKNYDAKLYASSVSAEQ
jgi:cell division protein FtsI (penicillin-binding protein 3)